MRWLACRLSMRAKHTQRCDVSAKTIAQERENSQTFSICFEKSPGVFLFPVLLRVRPLAFWAVSQEMGADFVMGPWLLCGFRRGLFVVGFTDLGKHRRVAAFQAGSTCETAQKLRAGFAGR